MCPVGPHPGPRAVVADKLVRIFRTHAEDIISRCAGVRPPSVPVCAPVSAADPRPAPRACTESRLLARPGRPASLRCPAPPLAPRTPFPTCVRCAPGLHCLPPAQGGGWWRSTDPLPCDVPPPQFKLTASHMRSLKHDVRYLKQAADLRRVNEERRAGDHGQFANDTSTRKQARRDLRKLTKVGRWAGCPLARGPMPPTRTRDPITSLGRPRRRRRTRSSSFGKRNCWPRRRKGQPRWRGGRTRGLAAASCPWWSTWSSRSCAGCRVRRARCDPPPASGRHRIYPHPAPLRRPVRCGRHAGSGSFPLTRRQPLRCSALRTRPSARRASTAVTGSTTRASPVSSRSRPSASRARCVCARGHRRGLRSPPHHSAAAACPRPVARLCSTRTGRPT